MIKKQVNWGNTVVSVCVEAILKLLQISSIWFRYDSSDTGWDPLHVIVKTNTGVTAKVLGLNDKSRFSCCRKAIKNYMPKYFFTNKDQETIILYRPLHVKHLKSYSLNGFLKPHSSKTGLIFSKERPSIIPALFLAYINECSILL